MSRTAVRSLLVAAIIASGSFAIASPALAADDPTCGEAVLTLSDATKAVVTARADDTAVRDAEKLYADLAAAKVEVAAAVKADNDAVPPLTADSQRTKDAKAAEVKAQAAVTAFEAKGVTLEKLRETAAKTDAVVLERARVAAKDAADKACKGADAPTTRSPQVIVVPDTSAGVDTGSW